MSQFEGRAIGARIALARDEAGLTQEEVGDLAEGFSKRSLQDYEAGVTIPYKHMREISALLGRPVEWFLHGDPERPEPPPADALTRLGSQLGEALERLGRVEQLLREEREGLPRPRRGTR